MTVRPALFADVPRLAELVCEGHARSIYADRGEIDLKETKALFVRSIQRSGGRSEGSTLVLVAEAGGAVEGFIVGLVDRIYHVLDKLYVTDIFFFCTERADPKDARHLLDRLIAWGKSIPGVIEIKLGITDLFGDWRRQEVLYKRAGLKQSGVFYKMDTVP